MHVLLNTLSWSDLVGFVAAGFTLLTFLQSAMVPMRLAALGANLCFIAFGALGPCLPVLVLHVILLPVNGFRLWQTLTSSGDVAAGLAERFSEVRPNMQRAGSR